MALALGTIYIVWGSTYLGIRWVVAELPPFAAGCIRFTGAGLLFLLLGFARGGAWPSARQFRNAALLGVALLGVSNGLVGAAERHITSSLTALILGMTPLWVALIDGLRPGGVRPAPRAIVGLVLGFVGTALLVMTAPGADGQHAVALGAGLLVLVASFTWASASLAARSVARPQSFLISGGIEMISGGLCQAVIAVVRGEWPILLASDAGGRAWLSLLYLGLVGSCLGYGAFSWLTRHARPTLVATYAYVNPLVAVALGTLLAGEALGGAIVGSGALVVLAVFLVTTARR